LLKQHHHHQFAQSLEIFLLELHQIQVKTKKPKRKKVTKIQED
jgi:hypothetical protein